MEIKWTQHALNDLSRIHEFLAAVNESVAARIVQSLVRAPNGLILNPRIGEQLFQFEPREVRRILVERYEIRYEIQGNMLFILRLWHTREDR
ncbi:MAG: type II toxin-antitoxin system RelE/ParE family toxin [Acidobacteria bacterium]|nr:type II toxin-antitoxin system RelE/ParE family toxin [Acidobacteriota bacterium]MCB9398971.1 type II toxin-antitoxin system RelE/ParE family toxin [Acidobacteriota bacterium]